MPHQRGRFAKSDRRNLWLSASVNGTAMPASSDTLVSSLNAGALALRPFTIIRTHLVVLYLSDQIVASETAVGAYGLIVVTDSAVAAGVASVPAPGSDTDGDWFVWQGLMDDFQFSSGIGTQSDGGHQYIVDSKAMRKVGPDDDVAMVASQQVALGALLIIRGRMLIKLH